MSRVGGAEKKEDILNMLGLTEDTKPAELSSFKHPLGKIKIARNEVGLKFLLEEMNGETLQAGEVRYQNKPN